MINVEGKKTPPFFQEVWFSLGFGRFSLLLDVARMCESKEGRGSGLINRAALQDYSITPVHEVLSKHTE